MARVDSSGDHIGRAGLIMASGTIVSRILGFFSAILLARTVGTVGSGADAFALANQLPNNIYALVAGGILTAVLVPRLVKAAAGEDGGLGYLNKIVTIAIVIFVTITALTTIAAPFLVSLYAQEGSAGGRGFSDTEIALAVALAYWCLPQVLFYALYSVFGEVLNARKVFGPFTWAPVVNNIIVIAGLLVFSSLFGDTDTARAVAWTPAMVALLGGGATLGIAVQATILLVFWRKAGVTYRPDFRWRKVGLGSTGRAIGWLFAMVLVAQIAGVVQANVASLATSGGDAGLAVLRFSWLLFMVPHSIFTVSLATAYFTRLAAHARDGEAEAFVEDVKVSFRRIGALMFLAAAGLFTLSLPFARVFGGGSNEVVAMATVISSYSLGLVAFSLVFVIQRVFYSLDETRTPFLFQLVHAGVFIVLAVSCSLLPSQLIAPGVALSASAASLCQLAVALVLLRRSESRLSVKTVTAPLLPFFFGAVLASAVGGSLLWLMGGFATDGFARATTLGALTTVLVAGSVMTLSYFGLLAWRGNPDVQAIFASGTRIIRRVLPGRE